MILGKKDKERFSSLQDQVEELQGKLTLSERGFHNLDVMFKSIISIDLLRQYTGLCVEDFCYLLDITVNEYRIYEKDGITYKDYSVILKTLIHNLLKSV